MNSQANDSKCSKQTAELHNTSYMTEKTNGSLQYNNMRSSFAPKRRIVTITK